MTDDLSSQVESDPDRTGHEKETGVTFLGNESEMSIFSAKKTVVKSLLEHDYFEADWFEISDNPTSVTVEDKSEISESDEIYAVSGTMPIGCLTVKSKPRSNNHQSSVVNAETIDPDTFQ